MPFTRISWASLVLLSALLAACTGGTHAPDPLPPEPGAAMTDPAPNDPNPAPTDPDRSGAQIETATLGAGCFWCVEAVLQQLDGVQAVTSGYMGGAVEDPSYQAVCSGTTGHAEVVQVTFDPAVISYADVLQWFWKLHDPTTLNRQGADVGTQYRSVIFTHSAEQSKQAEASKLLAAKDFERPIVTEISSASTYYKAEGYHQDYYALNSEQRYCRAVIRPKLEKLGLKD